MKVLRPVVVGSGLVLISGMLGTSGPTGAATVTLTGAASASCVIGSLSGDAAGNLSITCAGGGGTPPPTTSPACNAANFTATAGTVASLPLTCNSSASSASWSQTGGPTSVALSGTSPSANFPSAGTYTYSVTPTGSTGSGNPVSVSVTVGSVTSPPPTGGTGDTTLCTAYPGGYRDLLSYTLAPTGGQIQNFYTLTSNGSGYAPIAATRLYFGSAGAPGARGSIMVNESPAYAMQGVGKWASISTRPCDFADASAGGTAKWVTSGSSLSITYTVEDIPNEDYLLLWGVIKSGVRLRAGQTYYLNVVNGGPAWNVPSCPAGSNCGVVIDISRP